MREKMQGRRDSHRSIAAAVAETLEPRRLLAGIESGILVARGTEGADTISVRRTGGDDVIITTNGVNQTFDMDNFTGVRLEGLGGNDTFHMVDALVSSDGSPARVRDTTVRGGGGNDTISYAARTDTITFQIDTTASTASRGGTRLDAVFFEVETVVGGAGDDSFGYGDIFDRADDPETEPFVFRLDGGGGGDFFFDTLDGHENFGSIVLLGGDGNDRFSNGEHGQETFFGGAGNDSFENRENAYSAGQIDGGAGFDEIEFHERDSGIYDLNDFASVENATLHVAGTLIGTDAPNVLRSVGGTVQGRGGNDTLVGIAGAVTLLGEDGNDSLQGEAANDYLVGGEGDDSLDGGAGVDTVDGGPGNDTITNAEVTPSAPNIRISSRVLIADGSWGEDEITIERAGTDDVIVRVNEVSRQFDIDDFDAVLLRGNNGFDDIRVLDPVRTSAITRRVSLQGGAGNDVLFGSEGGTESLDGGDGNDFLEVRDNFGGDTAIGGNGTDAAQVDPGDTTSGIESFG